MTKKSWSRESYLNQFAMHHYNTTKPCTARQKCHITATKREVDLTSAKKCGNIEKAFDQVVSTEKKAFIGVLKRMYWLNKREIAHTNNFSPLLEL